MLPARLLVLLLALSSSSTCRASWIPTSCGEATPNLDAAEESTRDERWALPLERPGLENLHRVADGLYRGAQPEEHGYAELARLGVKTVVSLRTFHDGEEECERAGLDHVRIATQGWRVEDEDLIAFLRVATDPERAPVFVHCEHGADRTGVASAAYRVVVEGWSIDEAKREMVAGGFGFHRIWHNLVRKLEKLDVERLRATLDGDAAPR